MIGKLLIFFVIPAIIFHGTLSVSLKSGLIIPMVFFVISSLVCFIIFVY